MARTAYQRAIILLTMSLCTMLYALTLTIVNVALPQLQGALSATPDQVSWVITLNVVATAEGHLIEVQGTAEGHPFSRGEMDEMLDLALGGIEMLVSAQHGAIAS